MDALQRSPRNSVISPKWWDGHSPDKRLSPLHPGKPESGDLEKRNDILFSHALSMVPVCPLAGIRTVSWLLRDPGEGDTRPAGCIASKNTRSIWSVPLPKLHAGECPETGLATSIPKDPELSWADLFGHVPNPNQTGRFLLAGTDPGTLLESFRVEAGRGRAGAGTGCTGWALNCIPGLGRDVVLNRDIWTRLSG